MTKTQEIEDMIWHAFEENRVVSFHFYMSNGGGIPANRKVIVHIVFYLNGQKTFTNVRFDDIKETLCMKTFVPVVD